MTSPISRKVISSFLLITFSILNLSQYALASDTNNAALPANRISPEAGVSVSQFSASNTTQQDVITSKNTLTIAQAQTTQAPSQQTLPQSDPVQYYHSDGVISQTIAGIDFVRIEEHKQIWKSASRTEKIKARLKGKRAHGKYVDVVTSRIVGRTEDGSAISNIKLDKHGRVTGYARIRQQLVEGITYSITQNVQNISYSSGNDPSATITNTLSPIVNNISTSSNGITVQEIAFDIYGHISSYKASKTQQVGSDSFTITKQFSSRYNNYGNAISSGAKVTVTPLTPNSSITYVSATAGWDMNIRGYIKKVSQNIDNIKFSTAQVVTVDKASSGGLTPNVMHSSTGKKSNDGRNISHVTLDSNGLVSSFKQTRNQSLSEIQFNLEKQISNITYGANGNILNKEETLSPRYTTPDGSELVNIKSDPSLRVTEYGTKPRSQVISGINFVTSQTASVSYSQADDATVNSTGPITIGTTSDGRTISDVTLDSNGRVTNYATPTKTQTLNGITFTFGENTAVSYGQNGQPTVSTQGDQAQGVSSDGRIISDITFNASGLVSGYAATKAQSLNNISFTTTENLSVLYNLQGSASTTSLSKNTQGTSTDGRTIFNITLNQNGLVGGYKEKRAQTLSLIQFSTERQISSVTYNANGSVLSQDEGAVSKTYITASGITVLGIETDSLLRVKGYSKSGSQSINGINFVSSQASTVSYNAAGEATVSAENAQISGTASDGRVISDIALRQDGLVGGYKEKRNQTLALIQFNLQRNISNITYSSNGTLLNKDEVLTPAYTTKSGIEISDIQVDSSLKVRGYKKKDSRIVNKEFSNTDETRMLSEIANINYDTSNKVSSATLVFLEITDIYYTSNGNREVVYPSLKITSPYLLSGVRAEIFREFGIPVIDIDASFVTADLIAIQKVLRDMYPAHLTDEITIIAADTTDQPNLAGATLSNGNGLIYIIEPENKYLIEIESILVHEAAHMVHLREDESFKTEFRNEFTILHDTSGTGTANALNYNGHDLGDPSIVPTSPAYGMENVLEDFATMMQGWWWNSTDLLKRGIQQFTQLAKSIYLKKSLIFAEIFSYFIDGIEYTDTYKVTSMIFGNFARESSRIVRDSLGKITKIGDILIPSI